MFLHVERFHSEHFSFQNQFEEFVYGSKDAFNKWMIPTCSEEAKYSEQHLHREW